jgi:hypothetical protein
MIACNKKLLIVHTAALLTVRYHAMMALTQFASPCTPRAVVDAKDIETSTL